MPNEHDIDGPTVYPTHNCFDDAVDYLNWLVANGTPIEAIYGGGYFVVHGICVMSDQTRLSHAWVEDGETIVQGGLVDGARVWLTMTRAEFDMIYRIEASTRYTPDDVARLQRAHGPGPWEAAYRALCSPDPDRKTWKVWGR